MGKKILLWFSIFLLVMILASIALSSIFKKEIGEKIISEVNKTLKTELVVKDFDLALFRHFPNASAKLLNVAVKDSRGKVLLEAESIGFQFALFSLFKDKKQVKNVLIEDGALFISYDKRGRENYDIVKATGGDTSGDDMTISLNEAVLKNVELIYEDVQATTEASFIMNDAVFSGEFSASSFAMESMSTLTSRFIDIGEYRYLVGKDIGYVAKIFINTEKGFFDFEKLDVAIDKNVFKVNGFIDSQKAGRDFDLKVTCDEGNIGSIVQLLPTQYLEPLADFTGKGKFLFETTIKGRQNATTSPAINTKMILKDGRITSPRLSNDLKEVSFAAAFTNGKAKRATTSIFQIKDFKGFFNRELIEMDLKVTNANDPFLTFNCNGAVPMKAIYRLFDDPNITNGKGEIEVNNFRLKGRLADMQSMSKIDKVEATGSFDFDDATLYFKDEKMIFDRGSLILKDNDLELRDFKLEGAGSEIAVSGNFENLLPVLFADSLNSKKAELKFKANLKAEEMDLDRLVALTAITEEQKEETEIVVDSLQIAQNQKREFFANFLNGTFEADIESFNYNKIEGENFKGKIIFENNELSIKGGTEAMDGLMDLDGKLFLEQEPYLIANIEVNEVDMFEFFRQGENFGQDFLRSEHVSGRLNSRMIINAFWDETLEFQMDDLIVFAGVGIQNGELKNFEMLEDFSDFIHLNDLRKIKFKDAENWIKVQKSTLYMPAMFIESNALNMTVAGIHTFDQDIDYNVKVNAGQVLMNRLKPHNPGLKPQSSKKKGWFNVYYKIEGNLDGDYDYKMAKKEVKKDFEKSERLKRTVQRELEKKFDDLELIGGGSGAAPSSDTYSGTQKPPTASKDKNEVIEDDDEYIDGF